MKTIDCHDCKTPIIQTGGKKYCGPCSDLRYQLNQKRMKVARKKRRQVESLAQHHDANSSQGPVGPR